MNRISIDESVHDLLEYIVEYHKLRGKSSKREIVNKLIIEYGKRLTTGMPEEAWRNTMIGLINRTEKR